MIAIKDDPHIDLETLELQVASCLRVKAARVCVGISSDLHGHVATWCAAPVFQNERVSVLVTHDRGLYEGWNSLVVAASTRWVSFLGLGDLVVSPGLFERFTLKPEKFNAHFSRVLIYGAARSRLFGRPFRAWRHKFVQEVAFAGAVFDRELFLASPYDTSYKIAGDYEWLLRCSRHIHASFDQAVSVLMPAGGMSDGPGDRTRAECNRARAGHAKK